MNEHKRSGTPEVKPYQGAYQLACEGVKGAPVREMVEKSGAELVEGEGEHFLIRFSFLNRLCRVRFPEIVIDYEDATEEVPLWSKILLLHYLVRAEGVAPSGKWISFRQVPGGEGYFPAFVKRSQQPFLSFFGERVELFERAAEALAGKKIPLGDSGVIIPALPRVPIALVIWRGTEEFKPAATILYDETVPHYLSTEDIAVLSQQTVFSMIKWVRSTFE